MSRIGAVVLSLLFALSAFPAILTQERRVVPIGPLTRAANFQVAPDVASNGHGFLAIWLDGRAVHGFFGPTGSLLWASRFAADGTLTSLTGMRLADGVFDARIASDGNEYLIATKRIDGIYAQRFDDGGQPLADAVKVDAATTEPMTLVSNGRSYLLMTNRESGIQWRMLDLLGHPVGDPQVITAATSSAGNAAVVTSNGAYHLIYGTYACVAGQGCSYGVADVAVANGQPAPARTLVAPASFIGYVAAASNGDQFMVTWLAVNNQQLFITEQLFDSNDNAVTPARPLAPAFQEPLNVWWDGVHYLVSHLGSNYALVGQRVGSDGEPLDSAPFLVAKGAASYAAFARGGGRAAIVWSAPLDTPPQTPTDVYGRVVFDFNELAATTAEPLRLSNAPEEQHSPATALVAGKTIRVWRGGDGNGAIEMAIDGGDTVVLSPENGDSQHDPDIAAIGNLAFIAWRSDTRELRRVLGMRIDANGTLLDAKPIVIDQDAALAVPPAFDRVSVATDGKMFLVAWSGHFIVDAKRIATDGSLLDTAPIVASHSEFFLCAGVKAVWNGSMYVIVFAFEDNHLTLYPPILSVELFAARITSSGIPLDTAANHSVYQDSGGLGDLSAAANGDRLIIAFSETPAAVGTFEVELHTLEVSVNPSPLPVVSHLIARVVYPFNYGLSDLDISARGDTFLLAWSQDGTNGESVRAVLLDRGEPFVVADGDAYDVTVAPDANGFSFTYARTDPEAAYVARLFTRELVMPPERHRAVAR